jgi:hypothetical protein
MMQENTKENKPDTPKPEADPPYLAQMLADHPGLTREEALRGIKEAGG